MSFLGWETNHHPILECFSALLFNAGSCRLPKGTHQERLGVEFSTPKMTHFELEMMGKMGDGNFCPKKKHRKEEFGM